MNKTSKKSFFGRLLDKNDTSTSLSSCLIVLIMLMASLLLFLVIFSIGIEAWYNHTVASDINGWSLFVGAITSLIATAAGLKWGINHTDKKFQNRPPMPIDEFNECQENIQEENIPLEE